MLGGDPLPVKSRQWLAGAMGSFFAEAPARSESESRQQRRAVEKQLRQGGYTESRRLAELMVAFGLSDPAGQEEALKHLSDDRILTALEHVVTLKRSAEISEASARKIARIVRSLRFYAHDSHGDVTDIDVNESLDNALVILQGRIKHIAAVEQRFGEDLPAVKCGPEILQVWSNILINACDAIEETHKDRMGLLEIVSRRDGDRVVVEITNTGEPISDDVMRKMFDPFFTTKPVGKGTGLGLGICTNLLRRWGGTIQARNGDHRVTFEVTLPCTAAEKNQPFVKETVTVNDQ
jgi:C4-dicarboxylate-specific signal transduction histidine kinase